jgi:uncharacterized membrane protein YjjP (DUF1212 family)
MSSELLRKKVNFILKLGKALHMYGTNAPRLESALSNVARSIGIEANIYSTPTYLAISIDDGLDQVSRQIRVTPASVDLSRLNSIDEIAKQVSLNELNISDAVKMIDDLEKVDEGHPFWLSVLSFGLVSLSLSIIFKGNYLDILLSFVMGALLGVLRLLFTRNLGLDSIFEFAAGFICAFVTYLLKSYYTNINMNIVILASLIVFIPGLAVTISMIELAAKNLVSGTARFTGAMVDLVKISFGVMFGLNFAKYLLSNPIVLISQLKSPPIYWLFVAVLLASFAFTIIFNANKRDFIWILISSIFAIFSIKFFSTISSQLTSIFSASLIIGVGSNLFARLKDRPAMIPLLPGIIFLVPGAIGFTGIGKLLENDYSEGLGLAYQMCLIAISIVSGLFIANVIVNPKRSL